MVKYRVKFKERQVLTQTVDAVVECDDGDPVKAAMNGRFVKYLPVDKRYHDTEFLLEDVSYEQIN